MSQDGRAPSAPVGTTKGPGESAGEYTMVTPDREGNVKIGEFVYYADAVEGRERQIVGRVARRRPLKLFPDDFMADPSVPPAEVARILGFDLPDTELYEVTVNIMGHFIPEMGFVNPRIAPRPGLPVFLAGADMLEAVLCPKRPGQTGAVHIGSLLTRPEGEVPVVMDADEFTSTHLAIIAGTGAGKSYLAGVIVEELLRPCNAAAVLIVDPHGEYQTLAEAADLDYFRRSDAKMDYRARVKVVRPGELRVRRNVLREDDILYLLGTIPTPQQVIVREALRTLGRGDRKWTMSDLFGAVEDVDAARLGGASAPEDSSEDYRSSKIALGMRLRSTLGREGVFDDYRHTDLRELLQPGQCTVLQVGEMDRRSQQIVVATILRRAFEGRQRTVHEEIDDRDEQYLPFPVFILIEEAHRFAPAGAEVATTNLLKEVLSEGRKFGVGVGLITQRPGKLDQDALSQCMTQCIMRIVNPVDQTAVASAVESVGRDLLAELPSLSKGQAIIAGSAVNTTVLSRVRRRLTSHGGAAAASAEAWTAYFQPKTVKRRKAERTLFPKSDSSSERDLTRELFGED